MYSKYNGVLRMKSGVKFLFDQFMKLNQGSAPPPAPSPGLLRSRGLAPPSPLRSRVRGPAPLLGADMYATTIHAINSCVIKLSKLAKAEKVYRGLSGGTLPKEFWQPNEHGVKGGIEYGFSSTTTDRDKAVHFAKAGNADSDLTTCGTIFEMQMGYVPRRLRPALARRRLFRPLAAAAPPWPPRPTPAPTAGWWTAAPTSAGSRSTRTRRRCCCRRSPASRR